MKKTVTLSDGTDLTVRDLVMDDLDRLMDFYNSLPKNDRRYLRIDVTDRNLVEKRLAEALERKDVRLIALHQGRIVASGRLEFSKDDWRKKVGELRLIVAREFQHRGVGLMMSRELYFQGAENGIRRIVVKMMKPQKVAHSMVSKLGFKQETVIPEYVVDQHGRLQDLLVMTVDMKNFWKELEHSYSLSDWRRCR